MGKLVVKFQGRLVNEVNLKLGDMKIGRKTTCDIVFNDPLVSGEHALIKTVGMKSTIQDLGSKNGVFIENRRVKQHELKHGETIIIGGHTLMYRDEMNLDAPAFGKRPGANVISDDTQNVTTELVSFCQLIVVDGRDKGKHIPLIKEELLLDNPGKTPARISRITDGYLIEAPAGPGEAQLNGKPIPPGGTLLAKGDIIDVAGAKYQFAK